MSETEEKRGGRRRGSGRKRQFDEPCRRILIPIRLIEKFRAWLKSEMENENGMQRMQETQGGD